MKCGDTMKFKLVEEIALNEEMVYRIDYVDKQGHKDYFFMIGNNSSNKQLRYTTVKEIVDFLEVQKRNKEKVNDALYNILPSIVKHKVTIVSNKIDKDKSYAGSKYINTTHSTARKNSQLSTSFSGYLTHHLDGNEENRNESNLFGIEENDGKEKMIHSLLHFTNFNRSSLSGSNTYDVLVWDAKASTYVRKQIEIDVKVV